MKKHIKPAFHLAVGAVLAIMFAQQKPVNAPPLTAKEQWERYKEVESLYGLQGREREARQRALRDWVGANEGSSEAKQAYINDLNEMASLRKGLALLGYEPFPPTQEEVAANAAVASRGWQVIPPYSKEAALAFDDSATLPDRVNRLIGEENQFREQLDREEATRAKAEENEEGEGDEESSNKPEAKASEASEPEAKAPEAPAPAAGATEAPEPAAEAPEAPAPAAEASEAPEPAAEAPEAPAPEEAPDPGIQINR